MAAAHRTMPPPRAMRGRLRTRVLGVELSMSVGADLEARLVGASRTAPGCEGGFQPRGRRLVRHRILLGRLPAQGLREQRGWLCLSQAGIAGGCIAVKKCLHRAR